jgi:biopolymer transport protein ExbD
MNVTPLVDVVLVLLIIFMVVAPRMDQDVPIDLPGIFHPDPASDVQSDPFKLSLTPDGSVYLEDQKMTLDEAVGLLAQKHAEEPLRRLVIRADQKVDYGRVKEALGRTRAVGFPGSSLLVGEKAKRDADQPQAASAPQQAPPAAPDAPAAAAPAPMSAPQARPPAAQPQAAAPPPAAAPPAAGPAS